VALSQLTDFSAFLPNPQLARLTAQGGGTTAQHSGPFSVGGLPMALCELGVKDNLLAQQS